MGGIAVLRHLTPLILVILLGFPSAKAIAQSQAGAEYPQFEGIWETDWGRVALWQANDAVWGVYGSQGEIGGHIGNDGVWRFTYETGPDEMGTGWFTLDDDGLGFQGFYYSSIEPDQHGPWEGTLLGPNEYEVSDRAALDYEPGETPPAPVVLEPQPGPTAPVPTPGETAIEEEPAFTGEANSAWSGTWDTGRGYLVLIATDSTVYGSFNENGVFQGTVEDNAINATWSITNPDNTVTTGEALFYLSEDGASFRGTYSKSSDPNLWLPWLGSKVSNEMTTLPATEESAEGESGAQSSEPSTGETAVEESAESEEAGEEAESETESESETEEAAEEEETAHEIVLTADGDCWITVRTGGGQSFQGTMVDGDVKTFTDAIGFYLRAGAPEHLTVEFDGELMEWETYQTVMILPPGADVPTG